MKPLNITNITWDERKKSDYYAGIEMASEFGFDVIGNGSKRELTVSLGNGQFKVFVFGPVKRGA